METKVVYYDDLFYKVEYSFDGNVLKYRAWAIQSFSEGGNKDYDVEEDVCLEGWMNFDGCTELSLNEHFCDLEGIKRFYDLMSCIWEYMDKNKQ